jgi:hypothetical protein
VWRVGGRDGFSHSTLWKLWTDCARVVGAFKRKTSAESGSGAGWNFWATDGSRRSDVPSF